MTDTPLVKSLADIERDTESVALTNRVDNLAKRVINLTITDEKTLMNANDIRLEAKALANAINERRKFFVDPHNQFVKTINGWFKHPIDGLDSLIITTNAAMVSYSDRKEAAAAEEQRRILADKRTLPETKSEKLADIEQAPKAVQSTAGQTTFRVDRKLEIYAPYDVPRQYCIPSEILIKQALQNGIEVPGARLIEVKIPVTGRQSF